MKNDLKLNSIGKILGFEKMAEVKSKFELQGEIKWF